MELRHLRYFVAVADELSFSRAAERVGIGQPPLSQQIRDLETEIGERLFHRHARGVELTEAGRVFYQDAQDILARSMRAKEAARRAGRGEGGSLRIGFTSSSMFSPQCPEAIRRMRRRFPTLLLDTLESDSENLIEHLLGKNIDAAFVRPVLKATSGLKLMRIADERMILAVPRAHRLASGGTVALGSLADEPFVMSRRASGASFRDAIVDACQKSGFRPIVRQESNDVAATINLVSAEAGIALVPCSIAQIKVEGVVFKELEGRPASIGLDLATHADNRALLVRNLCEVATELVREAKTTPPVT